MVLEDSWIKRVDSRLEHLEEGQSQIKAAQSTIQLKTAVEEERNKQIDNRLAKIEASLTWVLRTVIGGFLAALVAWALGGGLSA